MSNFKKALREIAKILKIFKIGTSKKITVIEKQTKKHQKLKIDEIEKS